MLITNPHANDLDVFVDGYVIVSICLIEMESLSQILEYLKNLENMFKDSGDSLEKLECMLEKAKLEGEVVSDNVAYLPHELCLPKEKERKVVVFTRAPLKEFDAPHMRYSTPCAV